MEDHSACPQDTRTGERKMIRFLLAYLAVFHISLPLCTIDSAGTGIRHSSPTAAFGFAAKKPKRQTKRPTQHKGFGKAPPTVDEQIAAFKTRKPKKDAESQPCPCRQMETSNVDITYADCCMPLHDGTRLPMTPTEVLRSRYSAFAWRMIAYLMKTTHPTCGDYMDDRLQWAKGMDEYGMFDNHKFKGLTILGEEEPGKDENEAYLDFQVHLHANPTSGKPQGVPSIVEEKSRFLRDAETGMWTYASGDIKIIQD